MARFASITMSMRDIDRLKLIQAIIDGHLRASTAANRLQLSSAKSIGWYNVTVQMVLPG